MSLLNVFDIASNPGTTEDKCGVIVTQRDVVLVENLLPLLDNTTDKQTILYYTRKGWHMIDLLRAIVQWKSANVIICSYGMGEGAARTLAKLKNSGHIRNLQVVIDDRTETRTAGSVQVLKTICDHLSMKKVHAKATLVQYENETIAIIGSANYTENYRLEIGAIYRDVQVYNFFMEVIKTELYGEG